MKPLSHFTVAALASLALIACEQNGRQAEQPGAAPGGAPGAAPGAAVGTAGADDIDRDFVEEMLADGQAEIALGRMAQERASNPQVREFGEMMVRDHQKAGDELKQIASRHNVEIRADHQKHDDLRERLQETKGPEFDREYIRGMVDAHEQAINEVEDKAQDADNPAVQQWASRTLPVLRQHLDRARQLQQTLDGNRNR